MRHRLPSLPVRVGRPWRRRAEWGERVRPAQPGTAPGTLEVPEGAVAPVVRAMGFDADRHLETVVEDPSRLRELCEAWPVVWVNVEGLGDAEVVAAIGRAFGLHPLALEDVLHTHQRAKVESYQDHLYVVSRMATVPEGEPPEPAEASPAPEAPESEQFSLFLGEGYVLTFQERAGDPFGDLRRRLRTSGTRVRRQGADFLAYSILDAVVDHYFPVLDAYADQLEAIEDRLLYAQEEEDEDVLSRIYDVRRELISVRRAVRPMREVVSSLITTPSELIDEETRVYLRDTHDHVLRLLDILETDREVTVGLAEAHESALSARMTEVMETLTIIATIFIPLTFVTGLYGMNFDTSVSPWNMPELHWYFGYPFALVVMLAMSLAMLVYFRRKGWLGGRKRRRPVPRRRVPGRSH